MDPQQQRAFNAVVFEGKSILLTAPAGCGKSYTLRKIIDATPDLNIGVTAMTGVSAILINGRTLHSFLGIGNGSKEVSELVKFNKRKLILRKLDILIIDEISMLDDSLCTKISDFLKLIRKCDLAFGGLQIVFCGDLCQLKPVRGDYCFKSSAWKQLNPEIITLSTQHRQEHDVTFQKLLNNLRFGKCSKEDLQLLEQCKNNTFDSDIQPTKVYSLNQHVDIINSTNFEKIKQNVPSESIIEYPTSGEIPKGTNIQSSVTLCPGLQVMVTWNLKCGVVNGSRGVIVDCNKTSVQVKLTNDNTYDISYVTIETDFKSLGCTFMPLKLAYAISIHKTQGMTIDCMEIDLGGSIFEYGQAYTGLSRARSLKNVKIVNVYPDSFMTHPDVLKFYNPDLFTIA